MRDGHAIRAADTVRSDRAGRRRVLIADDPLIRMDLADMLAEGGFEVVGQVGDGERAAALAITLPPDLVIMDVKMPGKDGIQAAAECRDRPGTRRRAAEPHRRRSVRVFRRQPLPAMALRL